MVLGGGALTLDDLQRTARRLRRRSRSTPPARERIRASADVVQRAAAGDAPVYGVNTGFGKLAGTRIGAKDLAQLQLNLIRSHSVGVGEPLAALGRAAVLALKAASLARGHSGVREAVVDALLAVHNAGLVPFIPSQGSVGASGDLAPLAHLTLALIGEGEFVVDGERRPARRGPARRRPRAARARGEGRARAHQRHAGLDRARAARAVRRSSRCSKRRSSSARSRSMPRAAATARSIRASTSCAASRARSTSRATTARCSPAARSAARTCTGDDRVQDPYSLRCQPQVVGACLDQLRHAALVLVREANAVTDNPLVFAGG